MSHPPQVIRPGPRSHNLGLDDPWVDLWTALHMCCAGVCCAGAHRAGIRHTGVLFVVVWGWCLSCRCGVCHARWCLLCGCGVRLCRLCWCAGICRAGLAFAVWVSVFVMWVWHLSCWYLSWVVPVFVMLVWHLSCVVLAGYSLCWYLLHRHLLWHLFWCSVHCTGIHHPGSIFLFLCSSGSSLLVKLSNQILVLYLVCIACTFASSSNHEKKAKRKPSQTASR